MKNMVSIYPADFEVKIGFDGVRHILSELCQSDMGRQHVESMTFMKDRSRIETSLRQTWEMVSIIAGGASLPSDTLHDISYGLKEAKV